MWLSEFWIEGIRKGGFENGGGDDGVRDVDVYIA